MKMKSILMVLLALGLLGGFAAVQSGIGNPSQPILLAEDDPCNPTDPNDPGDGSPGSDSMPTEIPA